MNINHNFKHKEPNVNHEYRRLTGDIRGENCDFFVIEFNPTKNTYELIVRDGTPPSIRSHNYYWYLLCEGTYHYCLGYLEGKYKKLEIKRGER